MVDAEDEPVPHGHPASVLFQIVDTGIGIEEDELAQIFERFFRGNAGRETQTHGTGLGLSIVQVIVTRLQGTIHVESVPHRGTTVTVRLPVWETKNGEKSTADDADRPDIREFFQD